MGLGERRCYIVLFYKSCLLYLHGHEESASDGSHKQQYNQHHAQYLVQGGLQYMHNLKHGDIMLSGSWESETWGRYDIRFMGNLKHGDVMLSGSWAT